MSANEKNFSLFVDYLKELVRYPSVVGFEEPFFRILQRELEELGIQVSRYQGMLVAHGNSPDSAYLSAHVDRHGLLCTGPREFQYAAFIAQNKSEQTGNSTSEQMMLKIADRFAGETVHAYEPWSGSYLGSGKIRDAFINERVNNLFMVIDGMDHLPAGVPIAYADRVVMKDGRISAQLDNVLMVAIIVYLYSQGYQGTAFFTAQEEAGRSWRYLAEWFNRKNLKTDKLLVLDTSPFNTDAEAFAQDVVLREKDATAPFNSVMTQMLDKSCQKLKVTTIFKDKFIEQENILRIAKGDKELSLGRTELGRLIEATQGKVTGTTLQIPTIGYHTSNETATVQSVELTIKLLREVLKESF
jgi:putative aminopeptidase FrvX